VCSYVANALGFDTLLIQLNDTVIFVVVCDFLWGIEKNRQFIFFPKSTFINLSNDTYFAMFFFKMERIRIFSPEDTREGLEQP